MDQLDFEWDQRKNRINRLKHGVTFKEAQTVFFDPLTKIANDPDHSYGETRFVAVGYSSLQRLRM